MHNIILGIITALIVSVGGFFLFKDEQISTLFKNPPEEITRDIDDTANNEGENSRNSGFENLNESEVEVKEPGNSAYIPRATHVYQTFNNCGPATLSMVLAQYNVNVSQHVLGDQMRPYQNASGDNDDKSVFEEEFVKWAEEYGMGAINRPNGDIELIKKLTANGFPVIVTTWLNPGEDVGHYRIVRGYDDSDQVIIQDDSYQGKDIEFSYNEFLSLWQPFNYDYVVVYEPGMEEKVQAIIGSETNEEIAWENTLQRAENEQANSTQNPYPTFNISVASYHLGDYERTISAYEQVENQLPGRMLWYQIEPIQAYKEVGDYDRVFELTEEILNNGNRAFSRLYMIRGEIYLEQGDEDLARENFELALQYNENFEPAQEALEDL